MSSYIPPADDFDSFIDLNGGDANYAPEENSSFSGPSHDYGTFRQQTGFPTGSMSNVVYNDVNMDTNDFVSQPDFNSSYSTGVAMDGYNSGINFDMDYERTAHQNSSFFSSSNMDDFVDPTAVYEPQPPPVRMWPGMHSQQAEQAKAAALAKQLQQHQQKPSQHQRLPSPPQPSSSSSLAKGKQRIGSLVMTDAVAEQKISDLLNIMRHKSTTSPATEEDNDESEAARRKKDEEEMDEDERLLASEEGKKLSSKERRQLRNKVSARAFRSRRKEYITQLEGDLANKATEASDLRVINRKLLEENNQLKNLTRTVLSHPAFHAFLEDMSRNPTFVPPPTEMTARQGMSGPIDAMSIQQPEVKQEPERQQQQNSSFRVKQEDVQVNSARVPQGSLDMSVLNLGNNHWGHQNSGFNFQQPQVFAVFDVPEGPSKAEIVAAKFDPVTSASVSRVNSPISAYPSALPATRLSNDFDPSLELVSVDDCLAQINMVFDSLEPPSRRQNLIV